MPTWWFLALAVLAGVYWVLESQPDQPVSLSAPLAAVVFFLALWMVGTNHWVNPSYTVAAPYHAVFLLGGFLVGQRAGREGIARLCAAALGFAACLAAWALWERFHGAARANALFETPATLTATLNLALLPGLVVFAFGRWGKALGAILVLILAGFMAAMSRGGWLGLLAGLGAAYAIALRLGMAPGRDAAARLFLLFALAALAGWLLPSGWGWLQGQDATAQVHPLHGIAGADSARSALARLDLYELAWGGIAPSMLLTGSGYLGFRYLMDAGRLNVATYEQGTTYFVHNDYLQALLELGLPGLLALLALAGLPLLQAARARLDAPGDRIVVVALAAALASMAAHALVDFPFYLPVCLLLYGVALGGLNSMLAHRGGGMAPGSVSPMLRRGVIAAGAIVGLWMLIMPVAAEVAAGYAHRQWRERQSGSAAYWFELSRRLNSRDWRYHWYAGQFWLLQAAQTGAAPAATAADRAFADGFAANSREVANLLGRIALHTRLRAALPAPADPAVVAAWAARAMAIAPLDARARAEHARVKKVFGAPGGEAR